MGEWMSSIELISKGEDIEIEVIHSNAEKTEQTKIGVLVSNEINY
jgi:hypothetical protein